MVKSDAVYLKDIHKAILKIQRYIKNIDFETFHKEEMRQDAVIRQLEIIGEAANKLPKEFQTANPGFPLKESVRMRNFLIHGYDDIDLKIVWKTVQEDMPSLKKSLKLLKS